MSEAIQNKIFVVDDEAVISSTLAMILEKSGFASKSFTNPVVALEAVSTQPPDLLISDVVMPEMSGIELAIKIKEKCPSCKVLLFSGQAATADLLATAKAQGHSFTILAKPIHPKDLLAAIRNL